ncbi:MAG: threonine dehydratase [Burkholderiales bacterium]|nr:threonine dehydratase [Burkholderiales bacterium]
MDLPGIDEIGSAARIVYETMPPTPQYRWPMLCREAGTEVWLKHENHTPVGAFKVRGGLVYFSRLASDKTVRGVVTATRGNHGQSVALCASRYGIPATVVVPRGNSVEKNAAMRALGATIVEHGADFQEAREFAGQLAARDGLHFVPSFDRTLVAGVATAALELFRAVPGIDTLYVPIGLGSGICGAVAARDALGLSTEVVGVVCAHARAYAASFAARRPIESPVSTVLADGLACRTPDPQALDIVCRSVGRIVEVSDDEVAESIRILFRCTHNCAEGAGAAAFAAVRREKPHLAGRKVAAMLTGANIDADLYSSILARPASRLADYATDAL